MKLFVVIYNNSQILEKFLRHYRSIGISEFFIACDPMFVSTIKEQAHHFPITVIDNLDVVDSFLGGAVAVESMRRQFQRAGEWVMIVDLDEFLEPAAPLSDITGFADREGANVVRATMWDRFTLDGKMSDFTQHDHLRQRYPAMARFIHTVMRGADYKGVLVKGHIRSDAAHHRYFHEIICSCDLVISHYKWFGDAFERVATAHRTLQERGAHWAVEYERVLQHHAEHDGFNWRAMGGHLDPRRDTPEPDGVPPGPKANPADTIGGLLELSETVPSWTRGIDAQTVLDASLALSENPVIVEIGVFLGAGTILLAGARRLRGSGKVHCVDPFDCSGDALSVPFYRDIVTGLGNPDPLDCFEANITRAGLQDWVEPHKGTAVCVATEWTQPVDMLVLDGDQSPEGALAAFEAWEPLLRPGGTIVLRNTRDGEYAQGHDGHRRLAVERIVSGGYESIRQCADTTVARKSAIALPVAHSGDIRPPERQRVHLYALCWNDAFMLPHFFRHYDAFVDRYIIFDDGSDDGSRDVLAGHPKVELRDFSWSDPTSFVLSEKEFSNECWKESRGKADWVIVTDLDEHLYHSAFVDYLDRCLAAGVTAIPALGFQMVSDEVPTDDARLVDAVPTGAPFDEMMKLSVFCPDAVTETNFTPGRHKAQLAGDIHFPDHDEVLLLHFKYLGVARTLARQRALLARLGQVDLENRWGHQYGWPPGEVERDWQAFTAHSIDVRQQATDAYPFNRWWRPVTDAPTSLAKEMINDLPAAHYPYVADGVQPSRGEVSDHVRLLVADARRQQSPIVTINDAEVHDNDIRLRPPSDGRSVVRLADVAEGAARAIFCARIEHYENSADAVRVEIQLSNDVRTVTEKCIVRPGGAADIVCWLDDMKGAMSVEVSAEMAEGQGRNTFAWVTIAQPRIHYLSTPRSTAAKRGPITPNPLSIELRQAVQRFGQGLGIDERGVLTLLTLVEDHDARAALSAQPVKAPALCMPGADPRNPRQGAAAVLDEIDALHRTRSIGTNGRRPLFIGPALAFDIIDAAGQPLDAATHLARLRRQGSWRVSEPHGRYGLRVQLKADMLEASRHTGVETSGFYHVEDNKYCWTSQSATLSLPLFIDRPAQLHLDTRLTPENDPDEDFSLFCNGTPIRFTAQTNHGVTRFSARLPASQASGLLTEIRLSLRHRVQPKPPDLRELGLVFLGLSIEFEAQQAVSLLPTLDEGVDTEVLALQVTGVLTSCGRHWLLEETLASFFRASSCVPHRVLVVEDGPEIPESVRRKFAHEAIDWLSTGTRVGQIAAIDYAYSQVKTPFIFHMEDDWQFYAPNFIERSFSILRRHRDCLQVWIRAINDTQRHPVDEFVTTNGQTSWRRMTRDYDHRGIWHGFSFNPGLRRLADYVDIGGYGAHVRFDPNHPGNAESTLGQIYRDRDFYSSILSDERGLGYVRHTGDHAHVGPEPEPNA